MKFVESVISFPNYTFILIREYIPRFHYANMYDTWKM